MAGGGGGLVAGGLENFWCTQIVAGPCVYTPPPPLRLRGAAYELHIPNNATQILIRV